MYEIKIVCPDNAEKLRIGSIIHEQLRGQKDYIESNILLNIEKDNEVLIGIFPPVNIPDIIFPMCGLKDDHKFDVFRKAKSLLPNAADLDMFLDKENETFNDPQNLIKDNEGTII